MRRSRLIRDKTSKHVNRRSQNMRNGDDSNRSKERWRSASTHILVELKETLIKNGGKINVPIIVRTLEIFKKVSEVFGGTGYDEVFKIMAKVFEESIFSKNNKSFDDGSRSFVATPYFQLYKSLLEERKRARRNTTAVRPVSKTRLRESKRSPVSRPSTADRVKSSGDVGGMVEVTSAGGELLQNYSEYQTKKLNQMKKTMASKESAMHDLQYDRYILNEENKELKKNLFQEKDSHTKAYHDLIRVVKRKEEEIHVLKAQIMELMNYKKNVENSKLKYLKDRQVNAQLDLKNMFNTPSQIRTLRKLHKQFELIENQRINDFTRKSFALKNDRPDKISTFITEGKEKSNIAHRSANLAIERRNLKEEFVNQVNLLTHQMNLLQDRVKKLVTGNSDVTIDGRKLTIEAETSSDSQERREALRQRKKNFSFDNATYRYFPFEMINPLNFQNKLEVYIKRKKTPEMMEEERKKIDRKEFSKVFNESSDISQFGRRWAKRGVKPKPDEPENSIYLRPQGGMGKRSTSNFTASLIRKLESGKKAQKFNGDHVRKDPRSISPKIDEYYFELFHREVLSVQKEKPSSIQLPEGVTEIRLQHSRYHHVLPHSNVDSVLYSKSQMMTNLAIFEKLKAPKPLPLGDPLWDYYIKKHGRKNIPPTPRKLSLKDVRETIFQVYQIEFTHSKKYGSFKRAPTMAELLDRYLLKEYGVNEIAQKVYYETLRSVQYFCRQRGLKDIKSFHDCIMNQVGTGQGRGMSLCWKFAEWVYRKESVQDVRVIVTEQKKLHVDDLREEFFPKLYKGVGIRDIDLIVEDLSTFHSIREEDEEELISAASPTAISYPSTWTAPKLKRKKTHSSIVKKKVFLMSELLEFLFSRISTSREYWCRKFLEDQMKILEKVKIYKHEFSQVMAKIAPRFSGESVDFRFDEMCNFQQGHQIETSKLSVIFCMFNMMESYKSDKEV